MSSVVSISQVNANTVDPKDFPRIINQLQQNIIDGIMKIQQNAFNLSTVVGESKTAYLTESQFQDEAGINWVLQDGRSCIGSLYHKRTGNSTVPNACGRVQRMADNGTGVNPDGDLALGAPQADALGSHRHSGVVERNPSTQNAATSTSAGESSVDGTGDNRSTAATDSTGANETRMKNVTANFFIRIN